MDIDPKLKKMRSLGIAQWEELWDQHEEDFQKLLKRSDDNKIKINFAVLVDMASVPANIKTTLSFTDKTTDERTAEVFGDDEPALPGLDDDGNAVEPPATEQTQDGDGGNVLKFGNVTVEVKKRGRPKKLKPATDEPPIEDVPQAERSAEEALSDNF
jgi:hypothetical protein